jgi:hypothetical protein
MSFDIAPGRPGDKSGPHPASTGDGAAHTERRVFGEHPVTGPARFQQPGPTPISRDVLSRYLLTRALGSSVRVALQWTGVAVLALAILSWLAGLKILAVLIGLVAVAILVLRALFSAVSRRLSGAALLGENVARVDRLVGQTRRGLRHELRRVGLPGAPWGPLLIVKRLISRRLRAETLAKLSRIDLAAVVPQSRVDELYLVLGAHS